VGDQISSHFASQAVFRRLTLLLSKVLSLWRRFVHPSLGEEYETTTEPILAKVGLTDLGGSDTVCGGISMNG
jgi:hypothetical protein